MMDYGFVTAETTSDKFSNQSGPKGSVVRLMLRQISNHRLIPQELETLDLLNLGLRKRII